jgi:hypothetical protein
MSDLLIFFFGAATVVLSMMLMLRFVGFKAQKPSDYDNGGPAFDIRTHLNGPLICEGVLYGPTGRVTSRFVADMHGSWDGNKGHLKEDFRFDSGTVQNREWFLTSKNDGTFDAEAPDVVGVGQGTQRGSAIELKYRIKLADSAGGHELDTTDWMYMLDNGTIVNRSQMRKFGIKVAELVATIRKADV